jgi:Mor family transcriptional regulator
VWHGEKTSMLKKKYRSTTEKTEKIIRRRVFSAAC